jgi:hypothetical protein
MTTQADVYCSQVSVTIPANQSMRRQQLNAMDDVLRQLAVAMLDVQAPRQPQLLLGAGHPHMAAAEQAGDWDMDPRCAHLRCMTAEDALRGAWLHPNSLRHFALLSAAHVANVS